jgi:hypothetical protein
MFDKPSGLHIPRYVRMHVCDAGEAGGDMIAKFRCRKCGRETDWQKIESVSSAKRGVPCHDCTPPVNVVADMGKPAGAE